MDKTYVIDLLSLKEGKVAEFDYHIGREFFEEKENSDILGADVDVSLDVEKRHNAYKLEFTMEGMLEVPCDRCLEPVKVPIDATYDLIVRHGEDFDDSADDLLVIPENETHLDVSGMIYDTLLLEIPLRCVHAEGECNPEMTEKIRQSES